MKEVIFIIGIVCISAVVQAQAFGDEGLKKDTVKIYMDQAKKNTFFSSVDLMPARILDDSIFIYADGKPLWKGIISDSSGNLFASVPLDFPPGKKSFLVRLVVQKRKRYIEFPVSNIYPIYLIECNNGGWWVSERFGGIEFK